MHFNFCQCDWFSYAITHNNYIKQNTCYFVIIVIVYNTVYKSFFCKYAMFNMYL